MKNITTFLILIGCSFVTSGVLGQVSNEELGKQIEKVLLSFESLDHRLDMVEKHIDDLMWRDRLEDIAIVDITRTLSESW